jgi:hypothetical protein
MNVTTLTNGHLREIRQYPERGRCPVPGPLDGSHVPPGYFNSLLCNQMVKLFPRLVKDARLLTKPNLAGR